VVHAPQQHSLLAINQTTQTTTKSALVGTQGKRRERNRRDENVFVALFYLKTRAAVAWV
jgi:hypothetical protein